MKLDRLKLAKLVAHCCSNGMSQGDWEIECIDKIAEFDVVQPVPTADPGEVNELLHFMAGGILKIDAIKAYRNLTDQGLKESKDAIEKYWISKNSIGDEKQNRMIAIISEMLNYPVNGKEYTLEFENNSLLRIKAFIESF